MKYFLSSLSPWTPAAQITNWQQPLPSAEPILSHSWIVLKFSHDRSGNPFLHLLLFLEENPFLLLFLNLRTELFLSLGLNNLNLKFKGE